MLWGGASGGLELRRKDDGEVRLSGRFPYNKTAVLSDGGRRGRPKKERIKSRAFKYRVEKPDEEIHLLVGHDYDRPLASKKAETLVFTDTDEALSFTAIITRQVAETTHARDVLALIDSGLAVGISPGFRIPPARAVATAEIITEEVEDAAATVLTDEGMNPAKGEHNALIREILDALLYEMSIVTRPAYPEAQIEARNWSTGPVTPLPFYSKPTRRRFRV